jgi:hypothetical protein
LSSAARSDSQMMVQIDFTRMDDDADLHNKYSRADRRGESSLYHARPTAAG